MTKKYKLLILAIVLFFTETLAFIPETEHQIYIGCYGNSKQYLGTKKAKTYCVCILKKLNEKFNENQINELFKKKPKDIIETTKFASLYCEKEI
tara:strand:+ start:94 stop:375 length:282 start_codon:yes stop_codon:yes gene_type:complete